MKYLTYNYENLLVQFTTEAWINVTEIAAHYGKQLNHYFSNMQTTSYIKALCDLSGGVDPSAFVITKRGRNGGTWMHPDLAVHFGRWIDDYFAIWCDRKIREILDSQGIHVSWERARHASSASYKAMAQMLDITRTNSGKETKSYHYSNEARLVNWALTGAFSSVDRNSLSMQELDLLATLELVNIANLGLNLSYEERKYRLETYAHDWKVAHQLHLTQQM